MRYLSCTHQTVHSICCTNVWLYAFLHCAYEVSDSCISLLIVLVYSLRTIGKQISKDTFVIGLLEPIRDNNSTLWTVKERVQDVDISTGKNQCYGVPEFALQMN